MSKTEGKREMKSMVELVYEVTGGFLHPDSMHLSSRIRMYRGFEGVGKYDAQNGFFTLIIKEEYNRDNVQKIKEAVKDYLYNQRHVEGIDIKTNVLVSTYEARGN